MVGLVGCWGGGAGGVGGVVAVVAGDLVELSLFGGCYRRTGSVVVTVAEVVGVSFEWPLGFYHVTYYKCEASKGGTGDAA